MEISEDRHQWVYCENDGTLTIGLNDLALMDFGEIYGIEPVHNAYGSPDIYVQQTGIRVRTCDWLCAFRSEKEGGAIISPVSGVICGFNWPLVRASPSPINQNPYGTWIVKVRPDEPKESAGYWQPDNPSPPYDTFWRSSPDAGLFYNNDLLEDEDMSRCRYCDSKSYGSGCSYSPTKKHEHNDDEKACEFCGSKSYGSGCSYSPTKKHRHGSGANKCRWCGSTSTGSGCSHSPTGKHEK